MSVYETIRVFIGTEPKTEIARKVLECSIVRRTQAKVEFTPMIGPGWEYPIDAIKVGTGFSLRRWMIPAACGWQGKAIYLDADQVVFGDIAELWTADRNFPAPAGTSAWLTYQPDKCSASPWPQTSVMLVDCAAAKKQWGWHIDKVLEHLSGKAKAAYHDFMHGTWMAPQPQKIPVGWNHLNVFDKHTKLLHYTKEPEQPWYRPEHPLARHWKLELTAAINGGYVTREMLEEALAKWSVKEDWRPTNGLHPEYARFLPPRAKAAPAAGRPAPKGEVKTAGKQARPKVRRRKILWATYCPLASEPEADVFIETFCRHVKVGHLLFGVGGHADAVEPSDSVSPMRVDDAWLAEWRARHGGAHLASACVASVLGRALAEVKRGAYDCVIWLDHACRFKAAVDYNTVDGWFHRDKQFFYLRKDLERPSGVAFGFDAAAGDGALEKFVSAYTGGSFSGQEHWDYRSILQWAIDHAPGKGADLANASGDDRAVLLQSPLGPYVEYAPSFAGGGPAKPEPGPEYRRTTS